MMAELQTINLQYFSLPVNHGNFGDELSSFIVSQLLDDTKYKLVHNQGNNKVNMIGIGSAMHFADDGWYVWGSGMMYEEFNANQLKVYAVRGPLTRKYLLEKGIECGDVCGDPALLLPLFYQPEIDMDLKEKIGVVPHHTRYDSYEASPLNQNQFHLINPTAPWKEVINQIASCKTIVASALHGLICADAYGIPNVWLNEYLWVCHECKSTKSSEQITDSDLESSRPPCDCGWVYFECGKKLPLHDGNMKFKDYFMSQNRPYHSIDSLNAYDDKEVYREGNKVNLDILKNSFPFLHTIA